MDVSKFLSTNTGRLIRISGSPDVSYAFVPAPLPPQISMTDQLWKLLVEANKELGRLDGIGSHLPNPAILLTPLQNREAQRSSSLEGTIATPEQLALFDVNPIDSGLSDTDSDAAREVTNYSKALRFQNENKEKLPLSLRLIRQLHCILLDGVHRGNQAAPGEFRRGQVQIGKPARFVPPPANELGACLDQLEKYFYKDHHYDPLIEAFLVHYQFETIHPFSDGNGRVGRLLLSIMIKEWCQLSEQWLYMSSYFDRNKDEYIDRLFYVSTKGDWEGWISFCLQGVIQMSLDTQKRCDRLLQLRETYHQRLNAENCSGRLRDIVDSLFINFAATAPIIKKKYNISHPTALADLDRLAQIGILKEIKLPLRRQKAYYCVDILEITYE